MDKEQQPIISIILCTFNNAASLNITLTQLAAQYLNDAKQIEVIIVNNNSTDNTEEIALQHINTHAIPMKYFVEPRQGLSNARNTGSKNAAGTYLLFTDDDAEIPSFWASEYLKKIIELNPDCLYSKINIIWDQTKPWWFIPEYTSYFVGLDYGNVTLSINDINREFYGKNFCIKKSILDILGGFDPKLGRNGSKLIAGEETLLYRKMVENKKKVVYFPDAPVGHRLKEREYSSQNIKKLFYDGAYSAHHIAKLTARKKLAGRPARLLFDSAKTLFKSCILFLFYFITRNKPRSYYYHLSTIRILILIKLWAFDK